MVDLSDDLVRRLTPLRDLIHRARNTVFPVVGSGLSLGPPGQPEKGLMGWRGFLEELIEKARPEDQAELRDLLQQRRFLEMASLLEYDIGIGPGGLAQHIQREFARPNKPAPEVYKLVAALPTDHFATTNYDPWLKNAVAARSLCSSLRTPNHGPAKSTRGRSGWSVGAARDPATTAAGAAPDEASPLAPLLTAEVNRYHCPETVANSRSAL